MSVTQRVCHSGKDLLSTIHSLNLVLQSGAAREYGLRDVTYDPQSKTIRATIANWRRSSWIRIQLDATITENTQLMLHASGMSKSSSELLFDWLISELNNTIPLLPVYQYDHNKLDLWNWLTINQIQSEIFCPPTLQIPEDQFYAALRDQFAINELPISVDVRTIYWHDSSIPPQSRCAVRPTSATFESAGYIVGMDKIGSFVYIEEKYVLLPPHYPVDHRLEGTWADVEYRRLYTEEWIRRISSYFGQVHLKYQIARLNSAISSTVRQVIQALFLDRQAELRNRKEQERSQKELEDEIARRRSEGF